MYREPGTQRCESPALASGWLGHSQDSKGPALGLAPSPVFLGMHLQGPPSWWVICSHIMIIMWRANLAVSKIYLQLPASRALPQLPLGASPLGTYLGKFIQTQDLSAVVLPMKASARQSFQISHHFITGGQHHKWLTIQTWSWKQTQVWGGL